MRKWFVFSRIYEKHLFADQYYRIFCDTVFFWAREEAHSSGWV